MTALLTAPAVLPKASLDQLFLEARTHNAWLDEPVSDATLHELHDLVKWGPTAVNGSPLRVVFVRSSEAKARLLAAVSPGNLDKVKAAPVTAILAQDLEFYEKLPRLFPHADLKAMFASRPEAARELAFRNSSLQGGYFILAARALGLDVTRLRLVVVACATLITAAAVAIAGIIGWIGLLIPHAARLLIGPEFARLLPLSMLLGASFLLAVDTFARTLANIEVPPGVLSALIGTPLFLWLLATSMARQRRMA